MVRDGRHRVTATKEALVAAVPPSHPAPNTTLSLAVNASDLHVGGMLQQPEKSAWRPLTFVCILKIIHPLFEGFKGTVA